MKTISSLFRRLTLQPPARPAAVQPTLSQQNVGFIDRLLDNEPIDLLVEYGSGLSTQYYIGKLRQRKCKLVSVEVSRHWFFRNIRDIRAAFDTCDESLDRRFWGGEEYRDFAATRCDPYTAIIDGAPRHGEWARALTYGPFARFHPASGSRWSATLGPVWRISEPLYAAIVRAMRLLPAFAEEESRFTCRVGEMTFEYHLVTPAIKDQFGESPLRDRYADAGLRVLASNSYRTALVMIDGGPRHYIVDRVYSTALGKNVRVHLCLFDAYRPEYVSVLSKRPTGRFRPGNAVLMDGTRFYDDTDESHRRQMAMELWSDRIDPDTSLRAE